MLNAMIFAAGLGTRLQPLTNDRPKALVELGGQTLLERAIRKMRSLGVDRLVINVHHFSEKMVRFLEEHDHFGMDIRISDESKELLDTGGGLKKASSLFIPDAPVLIYNVDVLSDLDLMDVVKSHNEREALATLVVRQRSTSRYLLFDEQDQLCGWKNLNTGEVKPSRSNWPQAEPWAFSGIHVVSPRMFPLISEEGRFSIIDLYLRLARDQKVICYRDSSEVWMDLGKPEQLRKAEGLMNLKK